MNTNNLPRKQSTPSAAAKVGEYIVMAGGSAFLGLFIVGDVLNRTLSIKDPDMKQAVYALSVAALTFVATYTTEPKETRTWRPLARGLLSLAWGATMSVLPMAAADADKRYQEERKDRVFVDSKTVIGTKVITIADEKCPPLKKGEEVVFQHNGKTSYTVCPR